MNTAKERILANYALEEGTFYSNFHEINTFHAEKFCSFVEDIYEVANEYAGKELDRALVVAMSNVQNYLVESCMYHAQTMDCYEINAYPGDHHMTIYLEVLKQGIMSYFAGKSAGKPSIHIEEKPHKVLVFTTIEKLGYGLDIKTDADALTEEFKEFIESEYGFEKENLVHASIYAGDAMNGDSLYIEIISESKVAVEEIEGLIQSAKIRTRDELEAWINKELFTVLESDGDIDQYDEYLLEV